MKNALLANTFFLLLLASTPLQAQVAPSPEEVNPLLPGMEIPKATVRSLEGENVALTDLAEEGPMVLVFYRGGW